MNYDVELSDHFKSEIKRLIKKYHSLINEFDELINNLSINPIQGTPIGKNSYKIRLAIKSKGIRKS
jgi:mRNA-degrading endonuclease RelE of RelBE toxin-antitoxin system